MTLDEDSLVDELDGTRRREADARDQVRLARTLFARAVETPGGLKIDTIHAFCERLLHLVPFEANVPARFAVLDESQSGEMLAQATANVLADAASGDFRSSPTRSAVGIDAAGERLTAMRSPPPSMQALKCERFRRDLATGPARLRTALGLGADETLGSDRARDARRRHHAGRTGRPSRRSCSRGKSTDQKRAASPAIAAARGRGIRTSGCEHYLSRLLHRGRHAAQGLGLRHQGRPREP